MEARRSALPTPIDSRSRSASTIVPRNPAEEAQVPIACTENGFLKLDIHFSELSIVPLVALIAVFTIFALFARFRLIGRIFVCLKYRHVDNVENNVVAFIFVLRSPELVE